MAMETQYNWDNQENWWSAPGSPIDALCKLSKEAFKLAGDSWSNSNTDSPVTGNHNSKFAARHRRTQSDLGTFHKHSNSTDNLLRWKSHLQRALQWTSATYPEDRHYTYFDPEILANEKRQWYKLQSKTLDPERFKEPTSLFEHFVILGLCPQKTSFMTLEPQVLFKYPGDKKLPLDSKDLAAFCFPGGAKEHLSKDSLSFIFSLKVADNATVYGVCLHVQELFQSNFCSDRLFVTTSRCYCILTRVPFFELHYEVLNCIIAQECLSGVNHISNGIGLKNSVSSPSLSENSIHGVIDSYGLESDVNWMASTIPVESKMGLSAATEGSTISGVASSRWKVPSPWSNTTNDASDYSQIREEDDRNKNIHIFDDFNSENPEKQSDIKHRNCASDAGRRISQQNLLLEGVQNFETSISLVRSMESELEDDEAFYTPHKDHSYKLSQEMENKNDMLQIISGYNSMPVPARGSDIIFQPLEHLQPIQFRRSPISALELYQYHDSNPNHFQENPQVKLKLAAAEEALSLSLWSTATICQVLSLENVLSMVSAVLLEKQVVVLCPNLGVLSAVVLSLIPITHPFQWQSLFLPILPEKMLDFLDAPVPFIVGMRRKSEALMMKTSDLVEVDVVKNQGYLHGMSSQVHAISDPTLKSLFKYIQFQCPQGETCNLLMLPQHKKLIKELRPAHSILSSQESTSQKQPVYKCNDIQEKAAEEFLSIMRRHLNSLYSDLWSHTITSVQSNNDRVSILLKDSFIDSFPVEDQPFVELLIDTQLFTNLSDSILSSY